LQELQRREGDMRREAARAVILLWGRSSDFPAQGGPFPVRVRAIARTRNTARLESL
jgi:hypothetical protein